MNARTLLDFLERYYGERYSGVFLDTMLDYLDGRGEDFLRAAALVIVKRVSRAYGKAPGHAEFERHMDEILAAMPERPALPQETEPPITDEEREAGMLRLRQVTDMLRKKMARGAGS
ncbi:MAG: hypothetical protein FWE09_00145 [Treponema sp.]|nr:hypothetical protein [Treponema sp.]